jgi:hypothetical protein
MDLFRHCLVSGPVRRTPGKLVRRIVQFGNDAGVSMIRSTALALAAGCDSCWRSLLLCREHQRKQVIRRVER